MTHTDPSRTAPAAADTEAEMRNAAHRTAADTNREWLWRTLRPAGCVLVLLLAAAALLICFTNGRDPIPGYSAPQTAEYYAAHPDELLEELQQNVFSALSGNPEGEAEEHCVRITLDDASFVTDRAVLLRYFDESLLDLQRR